VTTYMLDTNIVSDLIRNPQGVVSARIAAIGEANVCTSIIVAAELRYGAAKRNAPRLTAQVDAVLAVLSVLSLQTPTAQFYGRIRSDLEASGTPSGANDLLIAAHAASLGYVLVSDNSREFERVKNLRLENWLERSG